MKHLMLILIFFTACTSKQTASIEPTVKEIETVHQCPAPKIIHDTVVVHDTIVDEKKYSHLLEIIKKKNDSLFIERFRLERVRYYNGIVRKNKSQLKFLSGWISRAVQ